MPVYSLDGRAPELPPAERHWIAPDAHVIGDVRLDDEVGVWFGAVLRGDNDAIRVGARANVQEGCMLHTDAGFPLEIGADCTVGHHAILHGCTIGARTLIGMGAIVLNGARIGAECLVGAGALVTERKVFADRSLIVGSPARAVRQLSEAEVAGLSRSALHYVQNWRRFAASLRVV